ncbi:exodeoxyribonuclease VII large subunit [Candidatus Uhrbacteria bacterium RIFOXYB12_FULL_58_10]|uniref:Exodeoxyribonuclease 7 large subunit n=1 Tax=Candidatus Uhrbacteria bacterium RIFOXYB2_FULL_57_15 TaxID=1802422 RepID=A0A1F7W4J4_9BACT|nr:MAG: exodeoxyribonuclease VII large subunit [Candidatus Uhrbacteria bacterium RIFOXYB12_FULL_58_10]OGL97711.1 MAG: exodeoxyribonuclease VII large subunit [Candidatus Uhrbacteria bacterium RIFOXYB2_FULL_57_15]OGM00034.1 MAG: exodeoxyribonuclease VII large subunit [Candidatus Uhrbacteria bacterium RIFOXYC12_FULL_57_11]
MDANVLSVSQYLQIVNAVLREHVPSGEIVVEGEISGFTVKDGKWIIFDLKDEQDAKTKVACFGTTYKILGAFENGMKVRVFGYPTVKPWSTFQIDVQRIDPVGEGALKRAYELLKKKLEAEGLFDAGRKRALPRFPERIGLITSRDAAAYGDFLRILNNRWGGVEVAFCSVRVQGKDAVSEILEAFDAFDAMSPEERPDLLVLTRGGGSLEDLHAFNDEAVARAVYGSKIPVVCGVGHERDESLCDFVADVRASTPSNAAERVVPNRRDMDYEIAMMTRRAEERLFEIAAHHKRMVERATRTVSFALDRERQRMLVLSRRSQDAFASWASRLRDRVLSYDRVLRQLDPTRVLARGYSIVTVGGRVVADASLLEIGAEIAVQLSRGSVDAEVIRTNGKGKQKMI